MLPIGDHQAACVAAYGQHLAGIPITDFVVHEGVVSLVFRDGHTYPLLGWESADHAQQSEGAADGLLDVIEGNYLVETVWYENDDRVLLAIGDSPKEGQWQIHIHLS
jgi:hypothetical protein